MSISGIGGGSFSDLQGLLRRNQQRLQGGGPGQATEKLDQVEKALGTIESNFDSIDLDRDGALTKSELKSFAEENGFEAPSGKFENAFSGAGLTRDRVDQLQEKVADAKGRISSLAGFAEGLQGKLQNQNFDTLQNLPGTQSQEGSLFELLFAESEEEGDEESSSTSRELEEAKIRSYGSFETTEREVRSSTVA